jgi:hypothetical protein
MDSWRPFVYLSGAPRPSRSNAWAYVSPITASTDATTHPRARWTAAISRPPPWSGAPCTISAGENTVTLEKPNNAATVNAHARWTSARTMRSPGMICALLTDAGRSFTGTRTARLPHTPCVWSAENLRSTGSTTKTGAGLMFWPRSQNARPGVSSSVGLRRTGIELSSSVAPGSFHGSSSTASSCPGIWAATSTRWRRSTTRTGTGQTTGWRTWSCGPSPIPLASGWPTSWRGHGRSSNCTAVDLSTLPHERRRGRTAPGPVCQKEGP